jgi:carotenoid 1,2-hydratase
LSVAERTAPWGQPIRARVELEPACAPVGVVPLDVEGLHRWEPRIVRGTARLEVNALGIEGSGHGYHDANHGSVALGDGVPGWWWARVHAREASCVRYQVHGHSSVIEVSARDGQRPDVFRMPAIEGTRRRSAWGLPMPTDLGAGDMKIPARRVLESSPFYAREETHADDLHALGESADFRRFRSPLIRWMAYFRMRTERAA